MYNFVLPCHLEIQALVLDKLFNLYIAITVYVDSMYNILWLPAQQQENIQMYAFTRSFTYS
jgi:hypothetical protein